MEQVLHVLQESRRRMKAVITAGGEGTRLYPSSRAFPKELIHFCGIPVIEYGIKILKENNITDIYVVTGRKKGALQDYLGDGSLFGVNIAYVTQEEPKGLGDAVLCTRPHIEDSKDDNFVLLLGDTIFTNFRDLDKILAFHQQHDAIATVLVQKIQSRPERYGVVKFKNYNGTYGYGEAECFYEKPGPEIKEEFNLGGYWLAIAGLYVLNKEIFSYLEKTPVGRNSELQLTDALSQSLNDSKKVLAYEMKGKRVDVGSWEYLVDERQHYRDMSDCDLNQICKSRTNILQKILTNKKGQIK